MLIHRENKQIQSMFLQSTSLQHSACCNISQVFFRIIQNIKDFVSKLFCTAKKTPVNPHIAIVIPTAAQTQPIPGPQVELPDIIQIPLSQEESDNIERLSFNEVSAEISYMTTELEGHRRVFQNQYRLPHEERNAEALAEAEHELSIADARLDALRARRDHLEAIQLPQHEVDAIAHMNAAHVQQESNNIWVNIHSLLEQLDDTPREERAPLLRSLDENYIRLRHLQDRQEALNQPGPDVPAVSEIVQIALTQEERDNIDEMDFNTVVEEMTDFDGFLEENQRLFQEQYRLPPEQRHALNLEEHQHQLAIADARLADLRARRAHLEAIQLPQHVLHAIAHMDAAQVQQEIHTIWIHVGRFQRQLEDLAREERAPLLRLMDQHYARLRHLQARENPAAPEANAVEAPLPVIRQRPLTQTEQTNVDLMSLNTVTEAIITFPERLAETRRNMERELQLPPGERNHDVIESRTEELESADAKLAALQARKVRLENFVIPPEELERLQNLGRGDVINRRERMGWDIQRLRRRLAMGVDDDARRGLLDRLDLATLLLARLDERRERRDAI